MHSPWNFAPFIEMPRERFLMEPTGRGIESEEIPATVRAYGKCHSLGRVTVQVNWDANAAPPR